MDEGADYILVERLGMAIEDGLGFIVCGGQLVNGTQAPDWIADLNGEAIEDIAAEARRRAA